MKAPETKRLREVERGDARLKRWMADASHARQFRKSQAESTETQQEPPGQLRGVPHRSEPAALRSGHQGVAVRRTAEGTSEREDLRCLKRFITSDVYRLLRVNPLSPAARGA